MSSGWTSSRCRLRWRRTSRPRRAARPGPGVGRAGGALLRPAAGRIVADRTPAGHGENHGAERSWLSRSATDPARRGGPVPGGTGHEPALAGAVVGCSNTVSTEVRPADPVLLRVAGLAAVAL